MGKIIDILVLGNMNQMRIDIIKRMESFKPYRCSVSLEKGIAAYEGALRSEKWSHRVFWIIGKWHSKK